MPYSDEDLQKDDEKDNPQGPQLAGSTELIGGGQPQAATSATAPKGPSSSDKFQNLNAYLDANQGNTFGQDFAGKVQTDVAKGSQAQAEAQTGFQNLADSGAVKQNTSLVDQAVTDPTNFVQDQGKTDQFKQQLNATYGGPNSFADAGDLYQKASGATTKGLDVANKATTEGGRFALLDNYFGRPEYSQGQKSLDNLLVSGNDNATQGLAQAQKNAQDQLTSFQKENSTLSDYAAQKRGETEDTQNYARAALGIDSTGKLLPSATPVSVAPNISQTPSYSIGKPVTTGSIVGQNLLNPATSQSPTQSTIGIGTPVGGRATPAGTPLTTTAAPTVPSKTGVLSGLYGQLNSTAQADAAKYTQQTTDIQNALASKDFTHLTDDERNLLGLTGHGSLNLDGVDPSAYLTVGNGPSDYTASSVATSDQAQKLSALAQLAGIDPTTLIDSSKAGTAPTDFAKLDLSGLSGAAYKAANQKFDATISAPKSGVFYSQALYPLLDDYIRFLPGGGPSQMPTDLKGQISLANAVNNAAGQELASYDGTNVGSKPRQNAWAAMAQARAFLAQAEAKYQQQKANFDAEDQKGNNFKY